MFFAAKEIYRVLLTEWGQKESHMLHRSSVIFGFVLVFFLTATMAFASVPTSMNVQGQLTDASGVPVPQGLKIFTFKIFDREATGIEIWPAGPGEQQTLLTNKSGLWNAHVGAVIPLIEAVFADTARWLEIMVDDGINPPETLSRVKLNTNPFAYRAAISQRAEAGGGWVDDGTVIRLETETNFVGIGTTNPQAGLHLRTSGTTLIDAATPTNEGPVFQNSAGGQNSVVDIIGPNDGGSAIAFGDTDDRDVASIFYSHEGDYMRFKTATEERMRITQPGNVGIGTIIPDEKLTVDGNVHITGNLTVDGSSPFDLIADYGYEDNIPECGTRSVSFNRSFSSPPAVIVGYKGDHGCDEHGNWFVFDVTTAGFTVRNGRPNASEGRSAYWIAIGPGY
jgi:hypothetical protein